MPKMAKLEKIHAHLLALLEIRKVLEDQQQQRDGKEKYMKDKVLYGTPWRRMKFIVEEGMNQSAYISFAKLIAWDKNQLMAQLTARVPQQNSSRTSQQML